MGKGGTVEHVSSPSVWEVVKTRGSGVQAHLHTLNGRQASLVSKEESTLGTVVPSFNPNTWEGETSGQSSVFMVSQGYLV